ncbi:MAG TPA: GNAT family protein [Acidimicrobiales bacterium]|jgi:RimJ/RimL family protein N-acetyltransferase|nr:GNAT family protein [Acidimicrobiales bacterium]
MRDWPLFELEIRTPRLVLRHPTDADLEALADVAATGIHPAAAIPFEEAWALGTPDEVRRSLYQWHWSGRGALGPESWRVAFGVWADGAPVGMQDLFATDFPTNRTFHTGSWLGQAHQGQGIGKEMRAAVLHFGFAGLGAARAATGAHDDNPASIGVTRSLGYAPNGDELMSRAALDADGRATGARESVRLLRFAMDRAVWEAQRRDDIELRGLGDACRKLLGATA